MANTKQAKKMIRKTVKKTKYNRWWTSRVKNAVKALNTNKDASKTPELMTLLQKTIDKAVKSNVIHKNRGNRIKSKSMKVLQSIKD